MKLRETLIILSALTALAIAGFLVFSTGSAEAAPIGIDNLPADPEIEPEPDLGSTAVDLNTRVPDLDPRRQNRIGGPKPTSGSVEGGIVMAVNAVGKLQSFTIFLREELNQNATDQKPITVQKTFKVPERRTPYFELHDVPFSKYGYRISVFAQGFNGSSRLIRLDQQFPYADDVRLAITPGSPFCIRLHDQHHNAVPDRRVRLVPVGVPVGRQMLEDRSDSFGSLSFQNVLRGDYKVLVEDIEIEVIQVLATRATGNLDIQYRAILVPDGVPIKIEILDRNSWGVAGAGLILYRIDTTQNIRLEGVTDKAGMFEFPHVTAGRYQLDISAEGFGPKSAQIKIAKDATEPVRKVIKLPSR